MEGARDLAQRMEAEGRGKVLDQFANGDNPEAHYTIATYYWEKAYRDFTTSQADKIKFVQAGNEAIDKAIKLKSDYPEALTYKNLLLRVQANLEKDPAKQQALLKQADEYRDRAVEIQKKQRAATGAGE